MSREARGNPLGREQQMLAIARALMAESRLLLLDEPSLGLDPRIRAAYLGLGDSGAPCPPAH